MKKDFWGGFFILSITALVIWASWNSPDNAQVGPPNQILCNQAASQAVGVTGNTQVVAAVAGQRIYICGWHVTNTAAAGTFAITMGTGLNCVTNNNTLVPALNVTSSAPSADHIDWASLQTGVGQALCINPSVATIAGLIWIAQF